MPQVTIQPSGFTAHLGEGEPVLTGLNRCGFTVRQVGCRRGGCGICKLDLVAGEVRYEKTVADSVLSSQERAAGTCLTCRAIPVGDITLLIDEEDVAAAPVGLLRYINTAARTRAPAAVPGPSSAPGKDN